MFANPAESHLMTGDFVVFSLGLFCVLIKLASYFVVLYMHNLVAVVAVVY